jgi:acyl carrier protein
MSERQAKIQSIIQQISPVQGVTPGLEQNLFDDGILDSFGLPDLVAALEKEFGVRVPDKDLLPTNFTSIQAIDGYLTRRAA